MAVSKQTIEFQAKEPAYLSLQAPISLADLDRVFSLYLPFLGAKAYALYHFMVQERQAGTKKWADHYLLLDTLTLSLPDLVHARKALEAVGLLKTFYQEAGGFVGYTYQIQSPMTAKDFFNEDLLSGLLFTLLARTAFRSWLTALRVNRPVKSPVPMLSTSRLVSWNSLIIQLPAASQVLNWQGQGRWTIWTLARRALTMMRWWPLFMAQRLLI